MAYDITRFTGVKSILNREFAFYVTRSGNFGYLHSDGIWRNSTNNGGKYTGYFLTEEDAKRAVLKDIAKHLTIDEEKAWLVLNAIYRINGNQLGAALDYAIPMMVK